MSIDRMRNMTAKVAIEAQADYILFLDDDVIVPPNYGLQMLLDCNADVASGKICVRGWPFDYMSFYKHKSGTIRMDKRLPKKGILDREAVGFSFALLKVDKIRKMPEPYFITGPHQTEDVYYCMRLKQMDHAATIKVNCECECGHILWPEIVIEDNRNAYQKYYMGINKIHEDSPDVEEIDRGEAYLKKIKKAANHEIKPRMRNDKITGVS